ncbi:MAG: 50S ribosomal protein L35 [bacterium]
MPKTKTRKSTAKRIKTTGTGKLMRRRSHSGHLFASKSRKRKRKLRGETEASKGDTKRIKRLLPYA